MRIDVHASRFLFYPRKMGVDLAQIATIGRQGLFLTSSELKALAMSFGATVNEFRADLIFGRPRGHADGLLQYLCNIYSHVVRAYRSSCPVVSVWGAGVLRRVLRRW